MATIYYDVEIIGGIPVAGSIKAEDGYIEEVELPDGTIIFADRAGWTAVKTGYGGIAKLVWAAIKDSESIRVQVEATRKPERPDTAPIYL